MRRHIRSRLSLLTAALTVGAFGVVGTVAASGTASAASAPLSQAQVSTLSQGKSQAVIVLLKNQHRDLAQRSAMSTRRSVVRSDQAPLLREVGQVHASRVKSYTLLNGFAATVPSADVAHLRADPTVAAVVPDLQIKGPAPVREQSTGKATAQTFPPKGVCPSNPAKPLLEPEALQLTKTAFPDPNAPQAQNIVTGRGVKVGWIADGIDINNPDFIRPNGQHVFVDYQDFSGDGINAPTLGAEAFGDASSIAAQGRRTYDLSTFANPVHPIPKGCTITVRGMAPGASLVGLKAFGASNSTPTSTILQAIDYGVTTANVDVMNESFGGNPFPDNSTDPISLVNDAAVAAGVVVVSSTGDAGTTNTIGSPSSNPKVISVGGTTSFQAYAQQTSYGFGLSKGTFASNNISSLSSGGITQNGRTPDLVAPGDSGWALCSPKPAIYEECTDNKGDPAQIQDFGGTSQSSPLTAGAAALVIQAYAGTHGGAHPSPALVKQILTSTATDLSHPSGEQGAGLLNSLAAVRAAQSIQDVNGTPRPTGSGLLVGPTQLTASGLPGTTQTLPLKVTNVGGITQTVSAAGRTLGRVVTDQRGTVTLNTTSPMTKTYIDQFGGVRSYVTKTFHVPAGTDRLDAAIAAPQPADTLTRIILIDPLGTYQAYSIPQGTGNFGHVDVHAPVGGTWTAIIAANPVDNFNGPVHFEFTTSDYVGFGAVSPSTLTLAPGRSGTFNVRVVIPAKPGDLSASVQLSTGFSQTESVPLTLRSLISTSSAGGNLSGTLTGGNGRMPLGQTQTFMFQVPPGQKDLGINLALPAPDQIVTGYLISPEGQALGAQSNATFDSQGNTVVGRTLQIFRRAPQAGRWEFALAVFNPIAGTSTSQPFTGQLRYNIVKVTSAGLPGSPNTVLPAGKKRTATVRVTNTGNTAEKFFVDARNAGTQTLALAPLSKAAGIPLPMPPDAQPAWLVPTEANAVTGTAAATLPVQTDLFAISGNPEVVGPSVGNTSTASVRASVVAQGPWITLAGELGPFTPTASPGTVRFSAQVNARPFDPAVTSTTGDVWLRSIHASAPPTTPVTIQPGKSATIGVTITPKGTKGTVIRGTLFVDDFSTFTSSGDELAGIPYTYKIG
jgi:subtilisin family serine protease